MRLIAFFTAALLLPLVSSPAGSESESVSYFDQRPESLKARRIVEKIEGQDIEFLALQGPITFVLSSIPGYQLENETTPGASVTFRHRSVSALMDFSLYRESNFPLERTVADAEQHIQALMRAFEATHEVEMISISDPSQRIYDRYFGQKPFNVVYQVTEKVAADGQIPVEFIYHECWLTLEGHVLVITLKAEKERYRGLLSQATRIWKDGSFR
ncbi:MAG: hypothetical protein MK080_13365 [Opitutales bacterium]|nr:hypothetical protein [Opitutales bacterium]NRA27986.1 hypothetical protein [Opitutales bacterium]